jgi:hypothetical protein
VPLPQDIRPAFQNIQDTLIRADQPRIEQSPTSSMRVPADREHQFQLIVNTRSSRW